MLSRLFSPFRLGHIELKNRVVMVACQTNFTEDHHITEQLKNFYAARARGGAGLIIIGFIYLVRSPGDDKVLCLDGDGLIPEYRSLTDAVHRNGAKVMAQIGMEHLWRRGPGAPLEAVGPSNVATTRHTPVVRPLEVSEIGQIEDEMVEGIRRAREANFDGVEIQAAQGLLLSQFLSPFTNKRTDQYGVSSPDNRVRFLAGIVEKARKKVGSDFTLTCKISGHDFQEGGNTLEDTMKIAPVLQKIGLEGINVAAGWHNSPVPLTVSMVPEGGFAYLSEGIKKSVSIPVTTSYRITTPEAAEGILAKGQADLIGLARALIADPQWPDKARSGNLKDIRPCIVCCRCLDQSFAERKGIFCSVNPEVGREGQIPQKSAARKVLIIGAGPAGIQAALTAKERGHNVSVVESKASPGGQLKLASAPPFKDNIARLTDFYDYQLKKSGIRISFNTEATPNLISREKPDSVIIATGSSAIVPNFPGAKNGNVLGALDILSGQKQSGDRVVIIGGGMIGCETAELLAGQGKKVVVLEMLDRMASDVGPSNRWVLLMRLKKLGVRMENKARVVEIKGNDVIALRDGKSEAFTGDSIVIAVGMKAHNTLEAKIRGLAPDVKVIGDAASARRIKDATEEGYLTGLNL